MYLCWIEWTLNILFLLNPKLLWRAKVFKIKCNQYWIFALPLNISVKNHAVICSIYQRRQRSIIETRLVKQTYVDSRYLLTCVGNSWQKNQGPYDSTYLNGVYRTIGPESLITCIWILNPQKVFRVSKKFISGTIKGKK